MFAADEWERERAIVKQRQLKSCGNEFLSDPLRRMQVIIAAGQPSVEVRTTESADIGEHALVGEVRECLIE